MSLVNMLFHSSGPNLSLINLHHFPQMRFRRIPSPGAFIHYLEAQTSNEHRILIYHHRGRSSSPLPAPSPLRHALLLPLFVSRGRRYALAWCRGALCEASQLLECVAAGGCLLLRTRPWNEGTRKLQRFTYMILLLETHSLAFKMPLVISYAILLT